MRVTPSLALVRVTSATGRLVVDDVRGSPVTTGSGGAITVAFIKKVEAEKPTAVVFRSRRHQRRFLSRAGRSRSCIGPVPSGGDLAVPGWSPGSTDRVIRVCLREVGRKILASTDGGTHVSGQIDQVQRRQT